MQHTDQHHREQPSLFDFPSSGESTTPVGVSGTPLPTGEARLVTARRLTRRSHPETSLMAAGELIASGRLAKNLSLSLRTVIQHASNQHSCKTGAELDELSGIPKRVVSKRLADLKKRKHVLNGERRVCSVGDGTCNTWYLRVRNWKWLRVNSLMRLRTRRRLVINRAGKSKTAAGIASTTGD